MSTAIEIDSEEYQELCEAVRQRFRSHAPAIELDGTTPPVYTAYQVYMAVIDEMKSRGIRQDGLAGPVMRSVEAMMPDLKTIICGREGTAKRWTDSAKAMAEGLTING